MLPVGGKHKKNMSTENNVETFLQAIKRDDIPDVKSLLFKNPDLRKNGAPTWAENFLLFACKHGSLGAVEEIGRMKPELAITKDHQGYTALHFASARGDPSIVKVLVELNPQVCLVEDNSSMIPLHLAALKGHRDVISELVTACPESLEKVTSQQETVFHLALKNNKFGAFQVLMEEIKKRDQEHLLNKKDNEGNNVLHIATSNRQVEIVKLLLAEDDTKNCVMQVNSINNRGFTAIELNYQNPRDTAAKEINFILFAAGAYVNTFGHSQAGLPPQSPQTPKQRACCPILSVETKNVVLVVLVMIAGATFATACNFSSILTGENHVASSAGYVKGVLSSRLPGVFYVMVFNTAGFAVSMVTIVCLIWSLPCRTILLFLVVTTFIVYVLVLENSKLNFYMPVGSLNISSSHLLWILDLAIIFSFFVVCGTVKLFFWCLYRFHLWLKPKFNCFNGPKVDMA